MSIKTIQSYSTAVLKSINILYFCEDKNSNENIFKLLEPIFDNIQIENDVNKAINYYKSNKIDLILIEIDDFRTNDIEFIKEIRKVDYTTACLIISSNSNRDKILNAVKEGIDGLISKPIEETQAFEAINKATQRIIQLKEHDKNLMILKQYQEITNKSSIISKTDPRGIITFVNDNFCEISGYSKVELLGNSHNIVRHPDTPQELFSELWHTIKVKKEPWSGVIKNLSKDGKPYYVKTTIKPLLDQYNNVLEYMALRNDVSAIMSEKKQLLTSLESTKSALLMIIQIENFDILDKFYDTATVEKIENIYGNTLLNHMPMILNFEKIYKLGDGRFALVDDYERILNNAPNLNIEEELLKFIKNTKNSTIKLENIDYDITIAVSFCYGEDSLYENAKYGIEKAIEENRSLVFSNNLVDEVHENAQKNIETIQMVKKALDNHKIISLFQPIIDNKTKKVVKYESLVRLINEKDEIISPYFFLDISKKGTYYTKITQKVIESSFDVLNHIKDNVSINISVLDIENELIRKKLVELVSNPNYKGRVIFELLEDEKMKDFQLVKDFIKLVKTKGDVKIAIDDFGSGYSNFERLLEYTPDILKIDGSLIKNIETDSFSRNLVETIVTFAKKQNIKTIAEYVENENIYNILTDIGIDYSQGFYFGKPEKLV